MWVEALVVQGDQPNWEGLLLHWLGGNQAFRACQQGLGEDHQELQECQEVLQACHQQPGTGEISYFIKNVGC